MKIKYLGTAAAEGIPAIFCQCEICRKAMELGGRNIRTRSQALIDETLLIDFPADTYAHFLKEKFPLSKIKACLITHSHSDHLYPIEIEMRKDDYAHIENKEPLTFYGDESAYSLLRQAIEKVHIEENVVKNVLITPFVSFETEGYFVMPIRASHDSWSSPVVYLIEKDGKSLLYAHDTSDFIEESWNCLKKFGKKIDFISFDCTAGTAPMQYVGHMNLQRCIDMRKKMVRLGLADSSTICVLNHFSHNGENVLYDTLSEIAQKEGFLVSYDGMEMTF